MRPRTESPRPEPAGGGQAGLPAAPAGPAHRFLEHTGEVELWVRGTTLGDVLAEAGRALGGLALRGRRPAPPGPWREVAVASADRAALLVDWLNELVYRAEAEREVPTEFEILEASDREVRARIRGPSVDQPPALVKAATLHGAAVHVTEGGLEAHVVLDV